MVRYAHDHPDNYFDRLLLHASVASGGNGGTAVAFTFPLPQRTSESRDDVGYGLGRLTHSGMVTDVSAHVGEALLITNVLSQAIRGPFGRARPYVTRENQNSDFHVGKGFTYYDYRSLPSPHSAAAFAAASALTAEIQERHPGTAFPAGILLYSAATIPGLTRMYLNQHWASELISGENDSVDSCP